MKRDLPLNLILPLALALAAGAHTEPQAPSADAAGPVLATPDAVGVLSGVWMQDSAGNGRLTGVLLGDNGEVRLNLDALLQPDRDPDIDNPMQVGVVRGQLYKDDGTDPLVYPSDLYVVGTWARLPDYGEASCLILRYQGAFTPVEVIGQLQGVLDLESPVQEFQLPQTYPAARPSSIVPRPGPSADAASDQPADSDAVQPADADAAPPSADADPQAGAPQPDTTDRLVAAFLGRWRIDG